MDETVTQTIMSPVVQFGFAGLCVVLLGILVWLINKLLGLLESTGEVIAANTEAIREMARTAEESRRMLADLRDKVLRLRCVEDTR